MKKLTIAWILDRGLLDLGGFLFYRLLLLFLNLLRFRLFLLWRFDLWRGLVET